MLKLPATSTMETVTVALSAAAVVYVGKVTCTETLPVLTPFLTISVVPLSVAYAAPDTIVYTVRASLVMVFTARLASVMVDDSEQLVGMPIPGAEAALEGLATYCTDAEMDADIGAGSVTVTAPVPVACTPVPQELLKAIRSASLLENESALDGTLTLYLRPPGTTVRLLAKSGFGTTDNRAEALTS